VLFYKNHTEPVVEKARKIKENETFSKKY